MKKIILKLNDIKAVQFGKFTWSSGITAPCYIDLRLVPSHPELFKQLIGRYCSLIKKIPGWEKCKLAGVPLSGISIATGVGLKLNLPVLLIRKEKKGHGMKKMVEGELKSGDEVILIEDLISTGKSSVDAANAIRNSGGKVKHVVAALEYLIGGRENLERENLELYAMTNILKVANLLMRNNLLKKEKLNQIKKFIADVKKS